MRTLSMLLPLAVAASALPVRAADPVAAPSARISTADFAALPELTAPVLSPDGRQIATRLMIEGKSRVVILNADRPIEQPVIIPIGETTITKLRWAGNQRLLLTVRMSQKLFDEEIAYNRLLAVDIPTRQWRVVDRKSRGIYGGDVLYAEPKGSWALVASQDDIFSYPSVKRVDLATGEATPVERAREHVWDWYADDAGMVRAGIAYEGRRWTVWYRDTAGEKLRAIRGKVAKADDSVVDRLIFGRGSNNWIVTNERTGRFALYEYDLKTAAVGKAIFEHPEVDLEDVTYNPLTGAISAIEYEDDRPRILWIDPEMKALQAKLDRALPHAQTMAVGFSADDKRVLVWSGGAADPGRYYLLDQAAATMHPVVQPYARIDAEKLSDVKMIRYHSRDGLTIRAYLTVPRGRDPSKLPLVLLPHGGPFLRDHWDYDSLVQFLASRGYAVLQPQFRGSTGFGKDFVARGYGEIGKKLQDDLDDGVDFLVKSGQVDPKRVCIVGLSYGGYAAMWGAARTPDRYRCAASMAGVSDLKEQLRFDRKSFAATRYFREWRTKVGGEGKVDLTTVSPIGFADRIKVPLFIAHGEKDATVPPNQSRRMVEALTRSGANVTSAFYKDSGHGFSSSKDLEDWLRRLEAFLTKHNPA